MRKNVNIPVSNLFGVPIAAVTLPWVVNLVHDAIGSRRQLQISVVNAAKIVNMHRDPVLKESVLSSDIILADGSSVVWASKFLGQPLPERVAGIDLMTALLKKGDRCGYRIFCLGATEEVSRKTAARITADYPDIILSGRRNGYFSESEESEIAHMIDASKPDIVFVAISSPKKESFIARWSDKIDAPVWHGVGGSFDVLAGKVRRAPVFWQNAGLEWLYRLKQEPRRLFKRYLITNLGFIAITIAEAIRR